LAPVRRNAGKKPKAMNNSTAYYLEHLWRRAKSLARPDHKKFCLDLALHIAAQDVIIEAQRLRIEANGGCNGSKSGDMAAAVTTVFERLQRTTGKIDHGRGATT
jgi:hypothetical protein